MSRTRKPVFWAVLYPTGQFLVVRRAFDERMVLPLFSSASRCEEWMMRMGFEQYFVSPPMWPYILRENLLYALDQGFEAFSIDPPSTTALPMEVAEIDDLLDQVEARL